MLSLGFASIAYTVYSVLTSDAVGTETPSLPLPGLTSISAGKGRQERMGRRESKRKNLGIVIYDNAHCLF